MRLGGSLNDWHQDDAQMDVLYDERARSFDVNKTVSGTIIRIDGEDVLVDIGYKSEGIVPLDEWSDSPEPPKPGEKVDVLLEEVEDDFGLILLSKRKADRMREWEKVIKSHKEGDVVKGKVVRKIKGGLLVNIGVNVFLPASQVDIRRPPDIGMYIDREIECVILKIDEQRRNIVVSRRKLIEDKREKMKQALLSEIAPGQLRKGTVKNIADFGAFVDLGGIDGLLHITDMSWGRISHPSEMVKIDDEIEVMILNVDRDKEKIALGLKQKFPSPWELRQRQVPRRHEGQGRSRQRDVVRRVREARGRHRRAGAHQRNVVDQADQPSQRARQHWRRGRSRGPGHQPGQAGNLAGHEADPAQSLGKGGREVSARQPGRREPSAT